MHLIDGHNALHRLGIRGGDHEGDRRELLHRVRAQSADAEVYFDALGAPSGLPEVRREAGVKVRYARKSEADRAILGRVAAASRPRDLIVVTDDRELAGSARQLGARTLRVLEFFDEVRAAPAEDKPSGGADGLTPEDFDLPDHVNLKHPPRDLR